MAGRYHSGRQWILSTGIANHGLSKASARKVQLPPSSGWGRGGPLQHLLLHCWDPPAFCSSAQVSTGLDWHGWEQGEPAWSLGWALGSWGWGVRASLPCPQSSSVPLSLPTQGWWEGTAGWGWQSWEPLQTLWKHLEKCGCPLTCTALVTRSGVL